MSLYKRSRANNFLFSLFYLTLHVKHYLSVFFLNFLAQSTYQCLIRHSLDAFALGGWGGSMPNLNTSSFHLPYNRALIFRAKELRNKMTPAEKKLWYEYLKTFEFKVLPQRPIDYFIVDFYCPSLKLVIEVDGESHYTQEGQDYDRERTQRLESYGI